MDSVLRPGAWRNCIATRQPCLNHAFDENMKMRLWVCCAVLFAGSLVSHGTQIFATNGTWQYFKATQEPSSPDRTGWRTNGFDDSAWLTGNGAFYYDSDVN